MLRTTGHGPCHGVARRAWVVVSLLLVPLLLPGLAAGQAVSGRAVDADDGGALSSAEVTLLGQGGDSVRTVTTDSAGRFGLPLSSSGSYALRIAHLGYRTATSRSFEVSQGELVDVELRLRRDAILLQPLVVRGRDQAEADHAPELYDRSTRNLRLGRGRIFSRKDLETLDDRTVRGALSEKLMRFHDHGSPCEPDIYWNGLQVDSWEVPVSDVEAIEAYRGASEVPSRYQRDRNATDCGVVLVWSRIHREAASGDAVSDSAGTAAAAARRSAHAGGMPTRGLLAALGAFVIFLAVSP